MAGGREVGPGSRVRLAPRPGGDVLDLALAGRAAVVESVIQDDAGKLHLAVLVEDDPGLDLASARHPSRRFLFAADEVEPLAPGGAGLSSPAPRVLVAGIGNVFFGDDGFGVAVARRLARAGLPREIEVADFGIRGMDLAYALGRPYEAAILVDAVPSRGCPGRLVVLEPDEVGGEGAEGGADFPDGHRLDPVSVLRLARRLGPLPPRVLLVGCEAAAVPEDADSMSMDLSGPVAAAVDPAAEAVLALARSLLAGPER